MLEKHSGGTFWREVLIICALSLLPLFSHLSLLANRSQWENSTEGLCRKFVVVSHRQLLVKCYSTGRVWKRTPTCCLPWFVRTEKIPTSLQRKRVNFPLCCCLKSRQLSRAQQRVSRAHVGMKGPDQPMMKCGQ